jgi:putative transposase
MARPARNARPDGVVSSARTFFATTKTSQGRPLLQSERNAALMIDVLRSYVAAGKFRLHDFVVMPDHVLPPPNSRTPFSSDRRIPP